MSPRVSEAPTFVVVGVVAAGLAFGVVADWRPGMIVVAAAMFLAAVLRLMLTVRQAGWLVVRGRTFDAAVLLTLGSGLLILATSIPDAT